MREYKIDDEIHNCVDWCIRIGDKYFLYEPLETSSLEGIKTRIHEVEDIEPIGDPQAIEEEFGGDAGVERIYLIDIREIPNIYTGPVLAIGRYGNKFTPLYPEFYSRYSDTAPGYVYWRNYEATYAYTGDDATHFTNRVEEGEYPDSLRRYFYDENAEYKYVDIGEVTAVYYTSWKQIEPAEDPNLSLVVTSESIYENNSLPLAEKATLILGGSDHHLYRHGDEKKPYIPLNEETPNLPLVYDEDSDTLDPRDTLSIKKLTAEELISNDFKVDENGVTRGNKQLIPIQNNPTSGGVVTYENGEYKTSKDLSLTSINVVDRIVVEGISYLNGDVVADKNISIHGDLIVDGTTYTTEEQSIDTNSDYIVLRHNQPSPLSNQEKSGIVVHNYRDNKSAAIAVDHDGIWRVSDNEVEHTTNYTNFSRFGTTYYDALSQTEIDVIQIGVTVARDADELSDCVWYNDKYYYHDNRDWFELSLVDNRIWFDIDTPIADETLIESLEALDKKNLEYYRSLTILEIDDESNQPILTREEAENLAEGAPLVWDSTNNRAISTSTDSGNQVLKSVMNEDGSISYEWGSSGSGSVWRGTQEELEEALSITDPNNENYIPNNALLIITDSEQTYLEGETQE